MNWTRLTTAVALVGLAVASIGAQTADPMVGTWTLNVAKSKGSFKSGTGVTETLGDALKVTADMVAADGTSYHWTWTARYDGKETPVVGKSPFGENGTVALTRVDAHTVQVVSRIPGKPPMTQTITTSADGKTRTITTKGVDDTGQPFEGVAIYDRK